MYGTTLINSPTSPLFSDSILCVTLYKIDLFCETNYKWIEYNRIPLLLLLLLFIISIVIVIGILIVNIMIIVNGFYVVAIAISVNNTINVISIHLLIVTILCLFPPVSLFPSNYNHPVDFLLLFFFNSFICLFKLLIRGIHFVT